VPIDDPVVVDAGIVLEEILVELEVILVELEVVTDVDKFLGRPTQI
jgi:hypothetical protein